MFIIGLYHKVLIPLPHKIQICIYGQNQINPIKGFRTLGVGNGFPTGRQPLLSDALSCRTAQIDRTFQQGHRFADVDVTCICQLLGKTFLAGRHRRLADPSRPWAKTYHGLYGRGSCSQGHRTGQAERQQSSGSLAEGHWQGSERPDIQAFFISLGARYITPMKAMCAPKAMCLTAGNSVTKMCISHPQRHKGSTSSA